MGLLDHNYSTTNGIWISEMEDRRPAPHLINEAGDRRIVRNAGRFKFGVQYLRPGTGWMLVDVAEEIDEAISKAERIVA